MIIDSSLIDESLIVLKNKINQVDIILTMFVALKYTFTKIQIFDKHILNETGGYDIVSTIPNPDNLSTEDNNQIRHIIYDDCMAKSNELDL